mgnify:CR=1 FL=1
MAAHSIGSFPAARLVAKAWLDPEFKKLALEDGIKASLEVGLDRLSPTGFGESDYTDFHVLEDTPKVKHVVVSVLCSHYPRQILSHSPERNQPSNSRLRLAHWARQVLSEFGLQLPEDVEIRVADSNQKCRYMVMPVRPAGTEGWTEEQLAEIVTRDCLIGVAVPRPEIAANAKRLVHPDTHPVHHDH